MRNAIAAGVLVLGTAAGASAELVRVEVVGIVEYNVFPSGPFFGVPADSPAMISFVVDSDDYLDSPNFPVRGYVVDAGSFAFTAGGVSVGLADPLPKGLTPYFVIRDNDPGVDGFFLSSNVEWPVTLPIAIPNATLSYEVSTQEASVLPSLDVLDAIGTYTLDQMGSFSWGVEIGPGSPMGMIFDRITISRVPAPGAFAWAMAMGGVLAWRRRR